MSTPRWSGSDRRARLPADWSRVVVPRILARDPACQLGLDGCTGQSTEVDHRRRGDDHSDANLQGACRSCHAKKTAAEGHAAQHRRTRTPPPHPGLRRPEETP